MLESKIIQDGLANKLRPNVSIQGAASSALNCNRNLASLRNLWNNELENLERFERGSLMKKRVVLICVPIIYSLFLIFVLFLKGNTGILSNATFTEYISVMCNFIPFATITEYIKAISNHSMNK